jgi:hypothetical protein
MADYAICDGAGITITIDHQKDQIVVNLPKKPKRFMQDNLHSTGLVRRNGSDSREWYAKYNFEHFVRVHAVLGVPLVPPHAIQVADMLRQKRGASKRPMLFVLVLERRWAFVKNDLPPEERLKLEIFNEGFVEPRIRNKPASGDRWFARTSRLLKTVQLGRSHYDIFELSKLPL